MNVLNHDILFEKYFEEISAIPRESGNEAGIANYFVRFAEEHNLEYYRDDWNNVVLYQKATPGYESAPTVILQAHSDMVCVKEPGVQHCFETDPIELVLEGDVLHANGTSLGADDGAGVATILALMADENAVHPPLEALFTTNEETGMDGAANFDYSKLQGRRLISLDSGGENCSSVNAAACESIQIRFPVERTTQSCQVFTLKIRGLQGGHSGECIDMERGNALKIAAAFLREYLSHDVRLEISSFEGGSAMNVIPSECTVTFACTDSDLIEAVTSRYADTLRTECADEEPGLQIILESARKKVSVLDEKASRRLVELLTVLPGGRRHKSVSVENFVTASSNVAVIKLGKEECLIEMSIRAETERKRRELRDETTILCRMFGAEEETVSKTPCWVYNRQSTMRKVAAELMPEYLGKPFVEEFQHGGLECGYFADRIPDVDIFVTGPVGREVHSPKEWLDMSSAHRVYNFLLHYLAALNN